MLSDMLSIISILYFITVTKPHLIPIGFILMMHLNSSMLSTVAVPAYVSEKIATTYPSLYFFQVAPQSNIGNLFLMGP